jgi:hypothetical protein
MNEVNLLDSDPLKQIRDGRVKERTRGERTTWTSDEHTKREKWGETFFSLSSKEKERHDASIVSIVLDIRLWLRRTPRDVIVKKKGKRRKKWNTSLHLERHVQENESLVFLFYTCAMARAFQRLAVIIGIAASFFGYLYHVPDSDGVPQMGRVRLLSATMKIVGFAVRDFGSLKPSPLTFFA